MLSFKGSTGWMAFDDATFSDIDYGMNLMCDKHHLNDTTIQCRLVLCKSIR
jgi:hypothetical protein